MGSEGVSMTLLYLGGVKPYVVWHKCVEWIGGCEDRQEESECLCIAALVGQTWRYILKPYSEAELRGLSPFARPKLDPYGFTLRLLRLTQVQ